MQTSPSRRGGVLLGLLITGIGLVCLVAVIGIAIARNVRVHSVERRGGKDVSIDTPAGNFSIHAHDPHGMAVVDVPTYPGARHTKKSGGSASFEWTSRDGSDQNEFTVAGEEMITDDSADKVVDFYQSQDPHWVIATKRGGEIRMELEKGGYKRFVVVHERSDGTHIGVATVGAPAAN